jgi:hypothetical protein
LTPAGVGHALESTLMNNCNPTYGDGHCGTHDAGIRVRLGVGNGVFTNVVITPPVTSISRIADSTGRPTASTTRSPGFRPACPQHTVITRSFT